LKYLGGVISEDVYCKEIAVGKKILVAGNVNMERDKHSLQYIHIWCCWNLDINTSTNHKYCSLWDV